MSLKRMWQKVLKFNDEFKPSWRELPLLLFSNALAGEAGEVCNEVTKLCGGGTNILSKGVHELNLRIECVDVFIQLVLLMEKQGLGWADLEFYFDLKLSKLRERMESVEK